MSRKKRIEKMKKELEVMSKGQSKFWSSPDLPDHIQEQFLRSVLAFETAATTTNFKQLTDAGVPLPNPEDVTDADMHSTLWAVINGLAGLGVYLYWTNHLSDRQLYEVLWKDVLRGKIPDLPASPHDAWQVDMAAGDPAYWKHYADEESRQQWLEQDPEFEMPPHEDPPYDRDRLLPVPPDQVNAETRH